MHSLRDIRMHQRAFTLIEVLIVVAIIGIAGAIIVPQMSNTGSLGIQAAARSVIADLLYAQNDAIADQKARRVTFHAAEDRYELTDADGNRIDVQWRSGGGTDYEVDFDQDSRFNGVDIVSAQFGEDGTLEFNDLGAPDSGGNVVLESAGMRYQVNVAPFTGRVTVEKLEGG